MTQVKCTGFIEDWIDSVINGAGGFISWEEHELVAHLKSREESIASFIIRCLANPHCEGSKEVIEAIIERRADYKIKKHGR